MQSDWPRVKFLQNYKLYDFVKTTKVIIMLQVKPKNVHINGLNFL